MASSAGDFVNTQLFVIPALHLRAALGFEPSLDPVLRLVVVDDFTVKRLGRELSFATWAQIGLTLFDLGYEQVFYLGFPNGEKEVGTLPDRGRDGIFVIGAAVVKTEGNQRSASAASMPARLLIPGARAPLTEAARAIVAPDAASLAFADRLGMMNATTELSVPAVVRIGDERLMPHIALHAMPELGWTESGPSTAGRAVPISHDGTLFIDYPRKEAISAASLRAAAFVGADGSVAIPKSPTVLERLTGGKIALLVPEAYTGARFVDSVQGKIPSYMATVALINSARRGSFVRAPFSTPVAMIILTPLAFFLAVTLRGRRLVFGSLAAGLGIASFGVVSLLQLQILLPTIPLLALFAAAVVPRFVLDTASVVVERLSLRRDLEMGRLVQALFLPTATRGTSADLDYAILFRPYGAMSGDWFQIYRPTDASDHTVIAIGDVVGKGPSAALNTSVIASTWRALERRWRAGTAVACQDVVRELDVAIGTTFEGQQNSTLALAVSRGHEVEVTAIASPRWIHWSASTVTATRVERRPANPLGLSLDEPAKAPKTVKIVLEPGDLLIAVTDGVLDGSVAEREFVEALASIAVPPDANAALALVDRLATEAGRANVLRDDFTVLLLRRRLPAEAALPAGAGSHHRTDEAA